MKRRIYEFSFNVHCATESYINSLFEMTFHATDSDGAEGDVVEFVVGVQCWDMQDPVSEIEDRLINKA